MQLQTLCNQLHHHPYALFVPNMATNCPLMSGIFTCMHIYIYISIFKHAYIQQADMQSAC